MRISYHGERATEIVSRAGTVIGSEFWSTLSAFDEVIRQVLHWPNLTNKLHDEAVRLLRSEGLLELVRCGGRLRRNGLLTFSRSSSRFLEMVYRVLSTSPGYVEVDELRTVWVVLPVAPTTGYGSWHGWAISVPGNLNWPTPREVQQHDSTLHTNGSLPISVVSPALMLVQALVDTADAGGECVLMAGDDRSVGNYGWRRDEVMAWLTVLSQVGVCRVELQPDEESRWVDRRSSAVTRFEVLADDHILVHIASDLAKFVNDLRMAQHGGFGWRWESCVINAA